MRRPNSSSKAPDAPRAVGWYVTGTDTGVGKTLASAALLHRLHAAGLRAVGMKPVASGCVRTDDGWRNEDALRLQAASVPMPAYDAVNPYALPSPTAPSLAAAEIGVRIDPARLVAGYRALAAQADAVVVEGVGGWAAPLDHGLEQADLVRALALPVVLVVGLRLGCLNHARLTERAISADGLALVGWIANRIDPAFRDAEAYLDLLAEALPAPRLGVLPYRSSPSAEDAAHALALPPGVILPTV
ncbi:MAG: dethiobiotin synthase [Xanthomonadaceae bacterium]|nr:dethiobiotin synthase [Xanthomonadaceae bacterium]